MTERVLTPLRVVYRVNTRYWIPAFAGMTNKKLNGYRSTIECERMRGFLWSPVFFGAGVGAYFSWVKEPELWIVGVGVAFLGAALFRFRESFVLRAAFLGILGFSAGIAASSFYGTPMFDRPYGPVPVAGTIVEIENREKGQRLLLKDLEIGSLEESRVPRYLHLTLGNKAAKSQDIPSLRAGMRMEAVAQIMPFSEPLAPGAFDFRRHGYFQGLGGTGYILGKMSVDDSPADAASVVVQRLRMKLQEDIKKTLSGDAAGLAIIFLTGDKSALSEETGEAMRAIGLAHLLAIAGLHVGLVGGIVFFVVRFLLACFPYIALRVPIKKIAAICSLFAICFYTLQVNAPIPTRRALIMTGIIFLGILVDRVTLSLRTVALAALLLLMLWPQVLLSPGFQLSFAAVMGLVSVHETLRRAGWKPFAGRAGVLWSFVRHVVELAGMSFVATLATLPLGIYHFQEVGLYSMLSNTLAIPLTSFVLMPLCVMADFLWPLGLIDYPLHLFGIAARGLVWLSTEIASYPGAFYSPPPMPTWLLAIASLGGVSFCLMISRVRWIGLCVMLGAIGFVFMMPRAAIYISPDGQEIGVVASDRSRLSVLSTATPDHFVASYWAHLAGVAENTIVFNEGNKNLFCDGMACLWERNGKQVVVSRDPAGLLEECRVGRDVLINPSSNFYCSVARGVQINQAEVNRFGAMAIYGDEGGLRIVHAREDYGKRAWSRWAR